MVTTSWLYCTIQFSHATSSPPCWCAPLKEGFSLVSCTLTWLPWLYVLNHSLISSHVGSSRPYWWMLTKRLFAIFSFSPIWLPYLCHLNVTFTNAMLDTLIMYSLAKLLFIFNSFRQFVSMWRHGRHLGIPDRKILNKLLHRTKIL